MATSIPLTAKTQNVAKLQLRHCLRIESERMMRKIRYGLKFSCNVID